MAESIGLHDVGNDTAADLFLHFLQAAVVQVLHSSTGEADEVMVVAPVGTEVVIELPVGVEYLADHSAGGKLFQVAVDGGKANGNRFSLEFLLHLFRTKVSGGRGQGGKDRQPARCDLQLQIPQHGGEIM